jgi:lysophospholipase L1-like esterase
MLSPLRSIFALLVFASGLAAAEPATPLRLKEGDLWVMAGDSITAQRQHSNFIESFFRARYPELKLQFRNSGVGGHTMQSTSARFDYDIAAFKPTIVSIELGMNDANKDDFTNYIEGAKKLIAQVRSIGATPVLFSSSPVNDGSKLDAWKSDRCRRIHPFTEALAKLAAEEKITFVDQYHPLLAMWSANKDANNKDIVGLLGDPVHPGFVGQYTMAATIIAGLGVEREVSSAVLKADGTVVGAKGCKISEAKSVDGGLSFTRLDQRGPWPMDPRCRDALKLMPEIADLSRYLLTVTDLSAGEYTVTIGGIEAARVSAYELAKGWNMATLAEGAVAERGKAINALVGKLQGAPNSGWRAAGKAKDAAKLAEHQQEIEALEAELAELCRPKPIEFVIRPAK